VTALAVAFELGLFGAAVAGAWIVGAAALTTFIPSTRGTVLGLAATGPLIVVLLALRRSSWPPIARLRSEVDKHLLPLFRGCSWWQLAAVAVAAGLGEEVLFRGFVQGLCSVWWGDAAGVLAASVLFGLAHMITPTYAALAGLVGVYLGWLALASGGLWAPIVAHAVYDLIALAIWVQPWRPPEA
jgi:membrane protease YdiL (CAAX protease family)